MHVVSISFRVQTHKRGEVLSAVEELTHRMRGLPSCLRARLYADSEETNAFTIVSEWRHEEDATDFLLSPDFRVFRGLRFLLRSEPVIVIDDVQQRVTRLCG